MCFLSVLTRKPAWFILLRRSWLGAFRLSSLTSLLPWFFCFLVSFTSLLPLLPLFLYFFTSLIFYFFHFFYFLISVGSFLLSPQAPRPAAGFSVFTVSFRRPWGVPAPMSRAAFQEGAIRCGDIAQVSAFRAGLHRHFRVGDSRRGRGMVTLTLCRLPASAVRRALDSRGVLVGLGAHADLFDLDLGCDYAPGVPLIARTGLCPVQPFAHWRICRRGDLDQVEMASLAICMRFSTWNAADIFPVLVD